MIRNLMVRAAFFVVVAFLSACVCKVLLPSARAGGQLGPVDEKKASVLFERALDAAEAPEKGDTSIQGVWVSPVVLNRNGQPEKLQVEDRLTLGARGDFTMKVMDWKRVGLYENHKGEYRTDATKQPKEIDFETSKGQTLRGIYVLSDKQLLVAFVEKGDRPTDFFVPGKRLSLMILKRASD